MFSLCCFESFSKCYHSTVSNSQSCTNQQQGHTVTMGLISGISELLPPSSMRSQGAGIEKNDNKNITCGIVALSSFLA